MFKRKIYNRMLSWKDESSGNTALLIEGARRVGKSTIVEEFARNEYESYIRIDFALAPASVRDLFDDVSDLNYLFLQLQLQYHVQLHERASLIVFDEKCEASHFSSNVKPPLMRSRRGTRSHSRLSSPVASH